LDHTSKKPIISNIGLNHAMGQLHRLMYVVVYIKKLYQKTAAHLLLREIAGE